MAGSVNKVILVGNLGADPEIKVMTNGAKMARISIATSESYTDKNGDRVTNTEWHRVIVWRGLAEVAEKYLKKGTMIYVEGKLRTRSYDDQEGNTKYVTEVMGDNFTMLGSRDGGSSGDNAGEAPQQQQPSKPAKPAAAKEGKANVSPDSGDDESFDDLPF